MVADALLSKADIVKELLRCGKDPVYFVNNYCKISHPIQGLINFKLYDYQKELFTSFNDYRSNIILKARQMGITTAVAAYSAWLLLFHKEKFILAVATKFKVAANLVKKTKHIIKTLPKWFVQIASIEIDNKTSFVLTNGSAIEASTTAIDAGRSEAASLVIIDEAAHIPGFEELWTALSPTLATGGRCIMLSSPKGVGNFFHSEFVRAEKGESEFHPTRLNWDLHPDRDADWEKMERRKYSPKKFAQEYELEFIASGDTLIAAKDLIRIRKRIKLPLRKAAINGSLHIWEEYDQKYSYLLTGDVARGDDEDYSAFHIFKTDTMEQVAEFREKVRGDHFAKLIYQLGMEYGACMVTIENNSYGFAVLERLQEMKYPNIYYSRKGTNDYVPPFLVRPDDTTIVPGFGTQTKTREVMFYKLEEFIRNDLVTVYSERTVNELEVFIWNKGRLQAVAGHNDDLTISLAIACAIREDAIRAHLKGLSFKKTILNSIMKTSRGFNTTISGMSNYDQQKSMFENKKEFLSEFNDIHPIILDMLDEDPPADADTDNVESDLNPVMMR